MHIHIRIHICTDIRIHLHTKQGSNFPKNKRLTKIQPVYENHPPPTFFLCIGSDLDTDSEHSSVASFSVADSLGAPAPVEVSPMLLKRSFSRSSFCLICKCFASFSVPSFFSFSSFFCFSSAFRSRSLCSCSSFFRFSSAFRSRSFFSCSSFSCSFLFSSLSSLLRAIAFLALFLFQRDKVCEREGSKRG